MPLTQFVFFHSLSGQSKIRRGVRSTLPALGLGGFVFWGGLTVPGSHFSVTVLGNRIIELLSKYPKHFYLR